MTNESTKNEEYLKEVMQDLGIWEEYQKRKNAALAKHQQLNNDQVVNEVL